MMSCVFAGDVPFRPPGISEVAITCSQLTGCTGVPVSAPSQFGLPRSELLVLLSMIGIWLAIDWIEELQTLRHWDLGASISATDGLSGGCLQHDLLRQV